MAWCLPLLNDAQRRAFDHPPKWTAAPRKIFCSLPDWAAQVLGSLVTPHSRGGFVLQVGYFQATGRFFPADRFRAAGAYVQQRYHLGNVVWERYEGSHERSSRRGCVQGPGRLFLRAPLAC